MKKKKFSHTWKQMKSL